MVLFSLSIIHGCNDVPLQLIECIESMKNDVKRKIGARDHHCARHDECSAVFANVMIAREYVRTIRCDVDDGALHKKLKSKELFRTSFRR